MVASCPGCGVLAQTVLVLSITAFRTNTEVNTTAHDVMLLRATAGEVQLNSALLTYISSFKEADLTLKQETRHCLCLYMEPCAANTTTRDMKGCRRRTKERERQAKASRALVSASPMCNPARVSSTLLLLAPCSASASVVAPNQSAARGEKRR